MMHQVAYRKPELGKILLAEDDEVVGIGLKKLLEHMNIGVQWAATFQEAVTVLQNIEVHSLVTDIFITPPKPDGLDLIEMATQLGIPSLIISSTSDFGIAKKGLNLGAEYLIEKPVQIEQLFKHLISIWENPKGLIARRERFLNLYGLTKKEKDFCRLMLKGLSNQEIANLNSTTLGTIKFYCSRIFEKFEVKSRSELFSTIFPT